MFKIVQFRDSTYGIRRLTIFGYRFLDLEHQTFWHSNKSVFFRDCKTTSLATLNALLRLRENTDIGTPI